MALSPAERQARYRLRHKAACLEKNRAALRKSWAEDPERMRSYARKWVERNPGRRSELAKRSYASDPIKRSDAVRRATAWQKANPERKRALHKAWREKNKERWAKTVAAAGKRYRQSKPEVLRAAEAIRKRAKHAAPAWGDNDRIKLVYQKAAQYGFEVDHVVPLNSKYVSGLHVWHNLQLLDKNLNRRKSNREWPDKWLR